MPNDKKRFIIEAIVSTFETGDPYGGYDVVAILDDKGGISYGKHQATDGGDNLDLMCFRYVDRGGIYANELEPYLPRLNNDETTKFNSKNYPQWAADLMDILARAGRDDPLMRQVQDEVFGEKYWNPTQQHCTDMQLKAPLSWCLIYDTCIQSGPGKVTELRKKFPEVPPSRGGEEQKFSRAFADARYTWLANYVGKDDAQTKVVRGSARRVARLIDLMASDNWRLKTPFTIGEPYNVVINEAATGLSVA